MKRRSEQNSCRNSPSVLAKQQKSQSFSYEARALKAASVSAVGSLPAGSRASARSQRQSPQPRRCGSWPQVLPFFYTSCTVDEVSEGATAWSCQGFITAELGGP